MDAETPKEPLVLQVLEKMSQLMTAAFGFVAALAWNDAIKAAITRWMGTGDNLGALFLYALGVTVIAVLLGLWIAWGTSRAKARIVQVPLVVRRTRTE